MYKNTHSFEQRKNQAQIILDKYSDRIPCIVELSNNCKNLPLLDKHKYLVPKDLTIGQFIYVIRKRIKILPSEAIFLYVNKTLPPTSTTILNIYNTHKDEDGFLYLVYSGENFFGSFNHL